MKFCNTEGSSWRENRLPLPGCDLEPCVRGESEDEGVPARPSRTARESRFLFLRSKEDLFRSCFIATLIRTRSPIFLIPISDKIFWSHSKRLSPVKLLALNSVSYCPQRIECSHSATFASSQARIESTPSKASENSELVGEENNPSWRAIEDICVLWVPSGKVRGGIGCVLAAILAVYSDLVANMFASVVSHAPRQPREHEVCRSLSKSWHP